jgi:hypothetical protein
MQRPEILSVRLSKVEKAGLIKAAKKVGCPVSDFVRRVLWRELGSTAPAEKAVQITQS